MKTLTKLGSEENKQRFFKTVNGMVQALRENGPQETSALYSGYDYVNSLTSLRKAGVVTITHGKVRLTGEPFNPLTAYGHFLDIRTQAKERQKNKVKKRGIDASTSEQIAPIEFVPEMNRYSDQNLKAELEARGWTVICTREKTITEEL